MADINFPQVPRDKTIATTADVAASTAAASAALAASQALPPNVTPIYVGGLIAGFKEVNGAAFNAITCNYTGDVLTSIVMSNPAKTHTFIYTGGVLTGMTTA